MNNLLSTVLLATAFIGLITTSLLLIIPSTKRKGNLLQALVVLTFISYFTSLLINDWEEGMNFTKLLALFSSLVLILVMSITTFAKEAILPIFAHSVTGLLQQNIVKQKYQKSTLQIVEKEKLIERLLDCMEIKKSYRETGLTIPKLSKQLNVSGHHLSQTINEEMECSFLDFINTYRIKEAQVLLLDTNYQHYTVSAIGYEVGFKSKSAFYAAFKKQTKMTPGNYRKSVVSN